jgi:hypothetical protein
VTQCSFLCSEDRAITIHYLGFSYFAVFEIMYQNPCKCIYLATKRNVSFLQIKNVSGRWATPNTSKQSWDVDHFHVCGPTQMDARGPFLRLFYVRPLEIPYVALPM